MLGGLDVAGVINEHRAASLSSGLDMSLCKLFCDLACLIIYRSFLLQLRGAVPPASAV